MGLAHDMQGQSKERERERQRQRQRQRQRDTDRQTETERQIDRQRQRQRDTDRQTDRQTDRDRDRDRDRQTESWVEKGRERRPCLREVYFETPDQSTRLHITASLSALFCTPPPSLFIYLFSFIPGLKLLMSQNHCFGSFRDRAYPAKLTDNASRVSKKTATDATTKTPTRSEHIMKHIMKTDLNKTETAKEDATFSTSHANPIPLLFIHDFFFFLLLLSRQKINKGS